jgi:hypothetical protein
MKNKILSSSSSSLRETTGEGEGIELGTIFSEKAHDGSGDGDSGINGRFSAGSALMNKLKKGRRDNDRSDEAVTEVHEV